MWKPAQTFDRRWKKWNKRNKRKEEILSSKSFTLVLSALYYIIVGSLKWKRSFYSYRKFYANAELTQRLRKLKFFRFLYSRSCRNLSYNNLDTYLMLDVGVWSSSSLSSFFIDPKLNGRYLRSEKYNFKTMLYCTYRSLRRKNCSCNTI